MCVCVCCVFICLVDMYITDGLLSKKLTLCLVVLTILAIREYTNTFFYIKKVVFIKIWVEMT